jgi:kynurenine formamidase
MTDGIDEVFAKLKGLRAVDLAPKLQRGIPKWLTHPPLVIDPTVRHARDGYYCQSVAMAEHTGCHVDAPAHIHADMMDATIDTYPVDHLVAKATVYQFGDRTWAPGELLTIDDVLAYERTHGCAVGEGEIALVDFGWMRRHWATDSRALWYAANAPGMTEDVAILLRERGVRAVGADTIACDTPIVDGVPGPAPGHQTHWLPNHILILECVANLHRLSHRCLFVASPMAIEAGSGSPLRPIGFALPE